MSHAGFMHPLLRRVPRIQSLAVFESAARTGSFTAAAAELGLTQSGVSRQISSLETALGRRLFDRGANTVVLNSAGAILLASVQQGLDTVVAGLEDLAVGADTFLLAANPGYAQTWLVPFLDSLQHALGDRQLRLRLFDRDGELATDDFDAAIHLTRADRLASGSRRLFDEEVVPVASPTYARDHGLDAASDPVRLTEVDLLHLDSRDRQWMGWADWFGAHGIAWSSQQAVLSYNNHALVTDEALAGRGVALGWLGLVDSALERELLVEVGPRVARPELGYYLIPGPGVSPSALDALAGWLEQRATHQ